MKTKSAVSSTDVEGSSICIAWTDQQSLVAHWRFTEAVQHELEQEYVIPFSELPFVLRLYDVTDRLEIREDGTDIYTDFDINHRALEWILYGVFEGFTYCVDLGIRMIDGRFYSLTRSDFIS